MRISALESIVAGGGRVALWGWGREGRATWRALRLRLPALPLTLFCTEAEADEARALADPALDVQATAPGAALHGFAVVLKPWGLLVPAPSRLLQLGVGIVPELLPLPMMTPKCG